MMGWGLGVESLGTTCCQGFYPIGESRHDMLAKDMLATCRDMLTTCNMSGYVGKGYVGNMSGYVGNRHDMLAKDMLARILSRMCGCVGFYRGYVAST
jgi:hypothetical protein